MDELKNLNNDKDEMYFINALKRALTIENIDPEFKKVCEKSLDLLLRKNN